MAKLILFESDAAEEKHNHHLSTRVMPWLLASLASFGSIDINAETRVTIVNGIGVNSAGVHNNEMVKLEAAKTTGVQAQTDGIISFDHGVVNSASTTAANADGQKGLVAKAGGQINGDDVGVNMVPKTGAGTVITASNMTGASADSAGQITLSNSNITMGGGVAGSNNQALIATGLNSQINFSKGAISTISKGSIGAQAQAGAAIDLSGASISTTGASSTITGSHGLLANGLGSKISAHDINISSVGAFANGARAENGAQIELTDFLITTGSAGYGHGVLASGSTSEIALIDGSVSTGGKGAVGVWAKNGAVIYIERSDINTSGAAVSAATPPAGEKSLSLSHALLATGADTSITGNQLHVSSSATSASGARAEDGAIIILNNSVFDSTSAATSTTTTAVLHALNGSKIDGRDLVLSVSGTNVGGARAEGAGSRIFLQDSSVNVSGAGSVVNPAAAARAMDGANLSLKNSSLQTTGQYAHGVSVEGAGSQASIVNSEIAVKGNRATGLLIQRGSNATVDNSRVSVDALAGLPGPWAPAILVDGAGSKLALSNSSIRTSPKTSYGVQALNGADITIDSSMVDTSGNYSTAISAANSTITANNTAVTTTGNDNAMGVLADLGSTIVLNGGSVVTMGDGSPIRSNLTFPHGLASRNANALLIANGTSVVTQGQQAYGAAVDDGGSMILNNVAMKTEGEFSVGLYAGIGSAKPGQVNLTANNVTVETIGDHAAGVLTSRQLKNETAIINLNDVTVRTLGLESHGLQSDTGAELNAQNAVVSTAGMGAFGTLSSNGAVVNMNGVSLSTQGVIGHGVVAKNGGMVNAEYVVTSIKGQDAAALYLQGTEAQQGDAVFSNSVLNNRTGPTIAVAGVANARLEHSVIGGSGQWLSVNSSAAKTGGEIPDMGTGQWQGVGQSYASAGQAQIDLLGSVATGSAITATGSHSTVSMRDASIWHLTDDSNLSVFTNRGSLVNFSAPINGSFKKLRVNQYQGDNGTIALNTYLHSDNSPSDLLVIDSGSATGSSNLMITNAGGTGALTSGNGIMVVDAINGASTEKQAFRLLNQVKAGPYEYTLHRASLDQSNSEAWYLRSSKEIGSPPAVDPEPQMDPDQEATIPRAPEQITDPISLPYLPQTPNFRSETSLYSNIAALGLRYAYALNDTLHERVGEERRNRIVPLPDEETNTFGPSLAWGRVLYQAGNQSSNDFKINALQLGFDLYRDDASDGSTTQAGIMANAGHIVGQVQHTDLTYAGENRIRAWGLGGYWTHFWPEGGYVDSVLQINRYFVEAQPQNMAALKAHGRGITASVEAGYPFISEDYQDRYVEPQLQLIYSNLRLDETQDAAASIRFAPAESLLGRFGVRLHRDWFHTDEQGVSYRTNAWIRPSIWHEFAGKTRTEFSSTDGYIPFTVDMGATWGEINIGFDHQAGKDTTFSGSLGFQQSVDGESSNYEAMLGVKIKF